MYLLGWIIKSAAVLESDLGGNAAPIDSDIGQFTQRLRSGDIILTKDMNPAFKKKLEKMFLGRGGWSHAGLYSGGGKVTHLYSPLAGKSKGDINSSKIREHTIRSLSTGPKARNLMALRVKGISESQALDALSEGRSLTNSFKGYNKSDAIRSALLPGKQRELSDKDMERFMCTFIPGYAYRKYGLTSKSIKHLKPSDFLTSDKTEGVAALNL